MTITRLAEKWCLVATAICHGHYQYCLKQQRFVSHNPIDTQINHAQHVFTTVDSPDLHGKVDRFAQVSKKATKTLPSLEPIHDEIETDRLDSVLAEGEEAQALEQTAALEQAAGPEKAAALDDVSPQSPPAKSNVRPISTEKKAEPKG